VTALDDPALVAAEYADDARLRLRAKAYTGAGTEEDARVPLVAAVVEARPHRVLEVGCGWGELAHRIERDTGTEVCAVDVSPRMVALARETGVDARLGDVQQLEFDDGSFDCVVAAWMLYHVPDLDRALAEIVRVLRPGGRLVAATNSATHLQELRDLVGSGPSPSNFTSENGAALLGRRFAHVRSTHIDGRLSFATRADVEEYVRASISMSPFVENLPARVEEPFTARRGNTIFVADRAA
jgi:SAM-dependent methyltransferase